MWRLRNLCCSKFKTLKAHRVAHSLTLHRLTWRIVVSVSMLKHKRVVDAEFLSSGSPQGLSSPMLVVIFLSRHCSLLCSPSFLIILSAIYQTMKSERKKKDLSFLCIMAYVEFFEEKCSVCSLFTCRKKELVVCRDDPVSLFLFLWILKKVFSSYCPERSQSQCISVDPVSVMYVCLTTLRNLSLDGI